MARDCKNWFYKLGRNIVLPNIREFAIKGIKQIFVKRHGQKEFLQECQTFQSD